jgi:hypothetical protein
VPAASQGKGQISRVFEFASAGEAEEEAKALNADGKPGQLGVNILVSKNTVQIDGSRAALAFRRRWLKGGS